MTASPPDTEYTVVFSGLVSGGTVVTSGGGSTFLTTAYAGGGFRVRRGVPPNAPAIADVPDDPPNATVPSTFDDGEIVLEGVFDDFVAGIAVSRLGFASGQFVASYRVTGGAFWDLVEHGSGRMDGGWRPFRTAFYSCAFMRLTGYSGYCASGYAGSIQTPSSVPVSRASWGSLKTRYR